MLKRAALLTALSCLATHARADIVGGAPPTNPEDLDCPRGAAAAYPIGEPEGSRMWLLCAPTTCTTDADCSDGRVCSEGEVGLCVNEVRANVEPSRPISLVGCDPDGTCGGAATCQRARRCVHADERARPASTEEPSEPDAPVRDPAPEDTRATNPSADMRSTNTPATSSGCGCRVSTRRSGVWGLLIGLLGLAWLRRRG